ncbi:MAG: TlpA disulfide reductase family protein [Janthinobacterium lividum]
MRRTVLAAGGTVLGVLAGRKLAQLRVAPAAAQGQISGVGGAADAPGLRGMSAMARMDPPAPLPPFSFTDASGKPLHVADYTGANGRGAVLNFWATWCAPCVAEMPSLALLSRALEGDRIAVLPVSADRGGAGVVTPFFRNHGIEGLPILLDPGSEAVHALRLGGLPTTVLVGPDGLERARLEGSADWGSPEAARMVREILA